MKRTIREQLHGVECRPGATDDGIRSAAKALGVRLPEAYVGLLRYTNGAEGFVGDRYIQLWSAEELLELNEGYQVSGLAPGVVLIGSSGGGSALGIDMVSTPPVFVNLPFIGMCREDMLVLGPSIADLLKVFPPDDSEEE